jgi:ribonucleoside-diphosphate reductase alpha chain
VIITAMDISICFADFPTEPIGETDPRLPPARHRLRQPRRAAHGDRPRVRLEGGRALAGAITSLMTGTAYKRSAELAGMVGPYDGYARNTDGHKRVMRKHAAANDSVRASAPTTRGSCTRRPRPGRSASRSASATAGATRRPPSSPRPAAWSPTPWSRPTAG